MKIGIIGTAAVAALAIVGCGKVEEKDSVVVKVDGAVLKQSELDADIAKLVEARKAQIPPDQIEHAKEMFGRQLAQMFVQKSLLLGEAKRLGIEVTPAERKAREEDFAKQSASMPGAPKSLAEFAEKHPLGKDRAMQDFEDGILIQKLFDQEVGAKIKIDPKAVEAQLAERTKEAKAAADKSAAAEKKIKELKKQLDGLKGKELAAKFAELAKANSECPSKDKGGDLDSFTRGRMVPEFEKVAFSLPVNTVSDPVKTQFGWHLIMTTEKIPAVEAKGNTPASPEKVRASHILLMARDSQKAPTKEEVEKMMKGREQQQAMRDFYEGLRAKAKIESAKYPDLVEKPAPKTPAAKPAQNAKPVAQSKPVEVKPAAKPAKVESKPVEVKPVAKPAKVESKPVEVKPAAKPAKVESKPVEVKPAAKM